MRLFTVPLLISLLFPSVSNAENIRVLAFADQIGKLNGQKIDFMFDTLPVFATSGALSALPPMMTMLKGSSQCVITSYLGYTGEMGWPALTGEKDFVSDMRKYLSVDVFLPYSVTANVSLEKKTLCNRNISMVLISGNMDVETAQNRVFNITKGIPKKDTIIFSTAPALIAESLSKDGYQVISVDREYKQKVEISVFTSDSEICEAKVPSFGFTEVLFPSENEKKCKVRSQPLISGPYGHNALGISGKLSRGRENRLIENLRATGVSISDEEPAKDVIRDLERKYMTRINEMAVDLADQPTRIEERTAIVADAMLSVADSSFGYPVAIVDSGISPFAMRRGVVKWSDLFKTHPRMEEILSIDIQASEIKTILETMTQIALNERNSLLLPQAQGLTWETDLDAEQGERIFSISRITKEGKVRLESETSIHILIPASMLLKWQPAFSEKKIERIGQTIHSSIVFRNMNNPLRIPANYIEWPGNQRLFR